MTSFGSINDIVDGTAYRRPDKKPLEPLKTHGGDILYEEDQYRLPNTGRPAVIEGLKEDDPWRGKRCSVRRCKAGVQFKVQERLDDDFGIAEPDPWIPSNSPLTVQLEAVQNAVRPATLVPFAEPVFLCLSHWNAYLEARAAKIVEEREARQPKSWPLHELNWNGASIRVIDGDFFELTDGDNRVMKLEVAMHLAEVTARLAGKTYETQVLSPTQREEFRMRVKAESFAKELAPLAIAAANGSDKPWLPAVNLIKD